MVHQEAHPPLTDDQKEQIALVSGRIHPELAEGIADYLGTELDPITLGDFPNGEIGVKYENNIRDRDVFVIQTHYQTPDFDLHRGIMEQSLMIDAARRADARSVTAVVPQSGYGRQDRKADGRVPISAAVVYQRYLGAADRIVGVDLHSQQAQGFVVDEKPFVVLTAFNALTSAARDTIPVGQEEDWLVVSTDAGGAKLAEDWSDELEIDFVGLSKIRKRGDSSQFSDAEMAVPDLTGRHVFIVDDMVDTGGTVARSAQKMKDANAERIVFVATHGLFSGKALETMYDSEIDEIIVANTVPTSDAEQALGERIKVVNVAPDIGAGILQVVTGGSVSALFNNRNHR